VGATLLTVLPEELELDAPEPLVEPPLLLPLLVLVLPAADVIAAAPDSVLALSLEPLPQADRPRHAAAAAAISSGVIRGWGMDQHRLFDCDAD
jgi:hypothetical protein